MEIGSKVRSKIRKESTISLAKKGDKEAFLVLIQDNKVSLYRIAKGILKSENDIEDAFQNTIIKAYEKIHTLKNDNYFKTWIIRILINECNNIIKLNTRVIPMEKLRENVYEDSYCSSDIREAVDLLDEDLRIVILLFYYEDIPQKEIAKILNLKHGTVRSRISRAKEKLYEIIKES
ncbi:RNA polymerase sigma factor [Clostridium frigidicarnis]|uniref:RNA polymerase sigma-70 factor, ECF subfamily n=1 Tax=Clostridium frigidicarnis TaxID=84698 RepID=A0A1I0XJI2_9CLOT|nr:sigma-70 family RNA polymerase sigma factor [Clostridium frigidicarnis]SFB00586.1 RNA polymerase sigma-70 factor, ECF subfamily [Clostridium frigidicarnis]